MKHQPDCAPVSLPCDCGADLSTLLAELSAKVEGARNLPTHVERIRAYTYLCHDLPDILPALREGIERLQREKATDAWHTGWQVAVRERDEARRECDEARAERNARARDVMHLEAELKERGVDIDTLTTALACKRDEYQQLAAQHAITLEERDALRTLVAQQREALHKAVDALEDWGAYVPNYFQTKHDLAGDIARLRAVLAAEVPS